MWYCVPRADYAYAVFIFLTTHAVMYAYEAIVRGIVKVSSIFLYLNRLARTFRLPSLHANSAGWSCTVWLDCTFRSFT